MNTINDLPDDCLLLVLHFLNENERFVVLNVMKIESGKGNTISSLAGNNIFFKDRYERMYGMFPENRVRRKKSMMEISEMGFFYYYTLITTIRFNLSKYPVFQHLLSQYNNNYPKRKLKTKELSKIKLPIPILLRKSVYRYYFAQIRRNEVTEYESPQTDEKYDSLIEQNLENRRYNNYIHHIQPEQEFKKIHDGEKPEILLKIWKRLYFDLIHFNNERIAQFISSSMFIFFDYDESDTFLFLKWFFKKYPEFSLHYRGENVHREIKIFKILMKEFYPNDLELTKKYFKEETFGFESIFHSQECCVLYESNEDRENCLRSGNPCSKIMSVFLKCVMDGFLTQGWMYITKVHLSLFHYVCQKIDLKKKEEEFEYESNNNNKYMFFAVFFRGILGKMDFEMKDIFEVFRMTRKMKKVEKRYLQLQKIGSERLMRM